jgi:hypothetical protein
MCNVDYTDDYYDIQDECSIFRRGRTKTCTQCGHSYKYHKHWIGSWSTRSWTETVVNSGMKSAYDNAVYWMSYYSQQENTYRNNISSIESSIKGYRSTLRNHCQEFNSEALLGRGGGTFQTHLEAMIKLLETRKAAMQLTGVGVDELRSLGDSIDKMKKQRSMIVEACGG